MIARRPSIEKSIYSSPQTGRFNCDRVIQISVQAGSQGLFARGWDRPGRRTKRTPRRTPLGDPCPRENFENKVV